MTALWVALVALGCALAGGVLAHRFSWWAPHGVDTSGDVAYGAVVGAILGALVGVAVFR